MTAPVVQPSEPAGHWTGDPRPPSTTPAGSDWATAVGEYSESLKRLEVAVGAVQGTLAKMPDNSAAIQCLIASQKRLDGQIGKAISLQSTLASGIVSVQTSVGEVAGRVADSASATMSETKSATTSLAESLTRRIDESKSVTTSAIQKLASAIPAAAPWWQLPAQALGLTGPLGAAAVAITWLIAKRAGSRSGKASGGTGSGAAEVAPHPFQS